MSTYYFIVCDKHKEITDAASRTAGGYCPLVDSNVTLVPFIITHHGCPVRIVSEHEDDAYSDDFEEWTKENVDEMYGRSRDEKS